MPRARRAMVMMIYIMVYFSAMTKIFKMLYMSLALAMCVACMGQDRVPGGDVESVRMSVVAEHDTRTSLNVASNSIGWSAGDRVVVIESDDRYAVSDAAIIDDDGRAHFEVLFSKMSSDDGFYYDAVYPASSVTFDEGVYGELVKVMLPAVQSPTATSFDAAADILVSQRVSTERQPESLKMRFKRLVAMGELTLQGMPEGAEISSVVLRMPSRVVVAGCNLVNCLGGEVVEYGYEDGSSALTITPAAPLAVTAPIYFTCNPFILDAGEVFDIEVTTTDGATYSRSVTVPAGRNLTFAEGDLAHFTVDMTTATNVDGYMFRRVSEVTSGKAYIIVAAGMMALPIYEEYDYMQVEAVAESEDGVIILDSANSAFVIDAVSGGYTIRQVADGRYLYQKGNYTSFNLSSTPSSGHVWSITTRHDDTFKILNVDANKFVQYNNKYTSFGSYSSMQAQGVYPMLYELVGDVEIGDGDDDGDDDDGGDTPVVPPTEESWLELPATRTDGTFPRALTVTVMDGEERNYTHYYDIDTYTTLWVAYPLESRHMGSISRPSNWDWNPYISTEYQVDLRSRSYTNSDTYVRGHLIPNASRNGIRSMQLQTFYVTNSVPQIHTNFNSGIWQNLEAAVQGVGEREKIYVVTGVAFNKVGESRSISYTTAKDDTKQVPIPNYFYKVVLRVKYDALGNISDARSVGFWFENKRYTDTYTNYAVSVDNIESWTGFDFFVNLPDGVESAAEKNNSWSTFTASY